MPRATRGLTAVICIGLLLNSAPLMAAAQEAPKPAPTSPVIPTLPPHPLNLAPISKGEAAPDDGLWMDPPTFTLYLREHIALEEANLRIASRDKLLQDVTAEAQRSWFERNGFWIGVGVGFLASVFVVYEAKQTIVK